LTSTGKERLGPGNSTRPSADRDASQAEGMRVLLGMATSQPEQQRSVNGHSRAAADAVGQYEFASIRQLDQPPIAQSDSQQRSAGSSSAGGSSSTAGSSSAGGRHAAAPPPYLDRRGVRFLLFSGIGGFVFLLGLGLQVGLTGYWRMSPIASYLIQAIVSIETSLLLNRWLTWRDRSTPFWIAFARFNAQKAVTIALNLALYAGLLRLGMNYLLANVALTIVFTLVNYVAGDRLVFIPGRARRAEPATPHAPAADRNIPVPSVSAVIPCRGNEHTIGDAVRSLLHQNYPGLHEIMLIGSPGDSTWRGLEGINHPGLTLWEVEAPPGVRDANFKRDTAVRMTSGDLIALIDSDIVLPRDWMSRAVAELRESGSGCVAGGMKSYHDSFWGHYTDGTWIGAKTPRIGSSYTVNSANFGARGRKPPILANTLFTRELYEHCPIDPMWSHGSYEDYEWFWRATKAGYTIRVCQDLFGWHHHRRGLRALTKEYRRSARGCAFFIRAHRDSPLARRRLWQAIALPLAAVALVAGTGVAAALGYGLAVAGLLWACLAILTVHQVVRSRSLESAVYPAVGFVLGVAFTSSLVGNLVRAHSGVSANPGTAPAPARQRTDEVRNPVRRFLPIAAICAVQSALSLTLVWSNTAFSDEADYLWVGRLLVAHWLHGTSWPSTYADQVLSGSPIIYPPLGALADSVGGLAGARILSLVFMLGATVLLYLTASRLLGRTGAVFATALWAFTEPVIRLAFATYDPLSLLLTALSGWLAVQAAYRRFRGELVAAAALALALSTATAYSGIVIVPVVIAFAFMIWRPTMGSHQAASCTGWFAGGYLLSFALLMTVSRSWPGLVYTVISRSISDRQSNLLVLNETWGYSGLVMVLAIVGVILALHAKGGQRASLLALLGCAAFVVPIAQLHDETTYSLDKHLAYGIWFAAIAAGYACSHLIRWLPTAGRQLAAACCIAALAYPAVNGWEAAWQRYHGWANATSFVTKFAPAVAQSNGFIYVGAQDHIAEYYTRQGNDWPRWTANISLDPTQTTRANWRGYYTQLLRTGHFGVIVLFYSTTFSSGTFFKSLPPSTSYLTKQQLLSLARSGGPGLFALTKALEADRAFGHPSIGPYDSAHDFGIYAIWRRVP
jgi:putative flippase GtrA